MLPFRHEHLSVTDLAREEGEASALPKRTSIAIYLCHLSSTLPRAVP